uniref:Transposase n=1 Tax=Haemonchus contortus TaxID=6289 RepID=A0A7I4XYZ3_HAECO
MDQKEYCGRSQWGSELALAAAIPERIGDRQTFRSARRRTVPMGQIVRSRPSQTTWASDAVLRTQRDWNRHETAKLVYATADCPVILMTVLMRSIGGIMSKGGPLFGRLNFVGATTSRYQNLTEPYRSVHRNRVLPVFQ